MKKSDPKKTRIRILYIFTSLVAVLGLALCVVISSLSESGEMSASRIRPKQAQIEAEIETEEELPQKTTASAVKKMIEEIIAESEKQEAESAEEEYGTDYQEETGDYFEEYYEEYSGEYYEEAVIEEYIETAAVTEAETEKYQVPETAAVITEESTPQAEPESQVISTGKYNFTEEEVLLLTYTVYAEAGASPYETQLAVTNVILDRALEKGSITDAIYAPGQFSVTWNGALERAMEEGAGEVTILAVKDALSGKDNRPKPYYYFNNVDMGYVGEWIGDVYFYLIG